MTERDLNLCEETDSDGGTRTVWLRSKENGDLSLEEVLARTRERGFDVDCTTPALTRAAQVVGTLPSDGLPAHVREITDQLLAEFTTIGFLSDESDDYAPRQAHPVATIAAPVFDQHGGVAMIVAVHPLQDLTRKRIDSFGRRVAAMTTAISAR